MLEHEVFLKRDPATVGKRPFLRFQPFSAHAPQYHPQSSLDLQLFQPFFFALATTEGGNIVAPSDELLASPQLFAKKVHGFCEIESFGEWHVFQPVEVKGFKSEQTWFLRYTGSEETVELFDAKGRKSSEQNVTFSRLLPYHGLVSIRGRHAEELLQKLGEQLPLLKSNFGSFEDRHGENSINAVLHAGPYQEGDSGMYEKLPVLYGHLIKQTFQ